MTTASQTATCSQLLERLAAALKSPSIPENQKATTTAAKMKPASPQNRRSCTRILETSARYLLTC